MGKTTPLEAETGAVDPLLQVCRLVGSASGIQFPLVPRAPEFIKQRDPVSAIAQAARVRTRQVMLKGKWWEQESGPMVAFMEQEKRPVALLPGRHGYQLYDPAARARTLVNQDLAAQLRGLAYVFYRPFPSRALTLRDILAFGLKDCGGDAATVLLMGIAAGLLGIVTPIFTGIIFDTIIPGAERRTLAEFSVFLVISALATALFTLTRSLATLRLQSKMEAAIQAAVWDRLLSFAGALLPKIHLRRPGPAQFGNQPDSPGAHRFGAFYHPDRHLFDRLVRSDVLLQLAPGLDWLPYWCSLPSWSSLSWAGSR